MDWRPDSLCNDDVWQLPVESPLNDHRNEPKCREQEPQQCNADKSSQSEIDHRTTLWFWHGPALANGVAMIAGAGRSRISGLSLANFIAVSTYVTRRDGQLAITSAMRGSALVMAALSKTPITQPIHMP
jgi:hypothetical protein